MRIFRSLSIAFSMYSSLPMPQVEWSKDNMKYVMCFFPLIGAVCGALLFGWSLLCQYFQLSQLLFAAVSALIPVAVSGGIHLDGFCDTMDALGSHQSMEKKLEILKDSHIGAFGVMGCCFYLLITVGLYAEIGYVNLKYILLITITFVLSRVLSGLSVVLLRPAKNSGLLHAFADAAAKKKVGLVLIGGLLLCTAGFILLSPIAGSFILLCAGVTFGYYRHMSYQQFGGITGDLAGFFLQLCESTMLVGVIVGGRIAG